MEEIKIKFLEEEDTKKETEPKPKLKTKQENTIVNYLEFEKTPPVPPILKDDKYASAEWRRATKELIKKNMIIQIDLKPLEVLCKSYSRWRTVEEKIDKLEDLTYKPYDDSNIVHARPEIKIAQTYAKQYKGLCESFGMTPSSRLAMIKGSSFTNYTPKEEKPSEPVEVTELILGG